MKQRRALRSTPSSHSSSSCLHHREELSVPVGAKKNSLVGSPALLSSRRRNEDRYLRLCTQCRPITDGCCILQPACGTYESKSDLRRHRAWNACSSGSSIGHAGGWHRSQCSQAAKAHARACKWCVVADHDGVWRQMPLCPRFVPRRLATSRSEGPTCGGSTRNSG